MEASEPTFASAISTREDAEAAASDAADRALDRMLSQAPGQQRGVDLVFIFITAAHAARAARIEQRIHEQLDADLVVAISAEGVMGDGLEIERAAGVSLLAASLPGVRVSPFILQDLPRPPDDADDAWAREHFSAAMGIGQDHRGTILFTDPFSVPLVRLLPLLAAAQAGPAETGSGSGVLFGGVVSGGRVPGSNVLSINGGLMNAGGVGISFAGPIGFDGLVSQGCRGFGPNMIVTKAKGNAILELAGKPAMDAIRDAVLELPEGRRRQIEKGLFIGRVINEYKDRFGRDDYLIRGIGGFDESARAILTDDFFRVGQTVRLHVRDAETAEEDLAMLLDAQKLHEPPAASLLLAGQGRGRRFYGEPHRDIRAVNSAFATPPDGVSRAKSGEEIDVSRAQRVPLAGCFVSGEIGPVGGGTHLHSQTLAMGLFRR
ncbi:MAG: FIST N-terminal domain-containing protein [Planctomycetota bacterium]